VVIYQQVARDREQPGSHRRAAGIKAAPRPQRDDWNATDSTPSCNSRRHIHNHGGAWSASANLTLARHFLSYEPSVDFEEGLLRTIHHLAETQKALYPGWALR